MSTSNFALAKQEEAASRSNSSGADTGGLFYHMKMTFEEEMFFLIGVIDLC